MDDNYSGAALRSRRRALGLARNKLAAFSGCSSVLIREFESGRFVPKNSRKIQQCFAKIAEIERERMQELDVERDYFVRAVNHFQALPPHEQARGWPEGITNGEILQRTSGLLASLGVADRGLDTN